MRSCIKEVEEIKNDNHKTTNLGLKTVTIKMSNVFDEFLHEILIIT